MGAGGRGAEFTSDDVVDAFLDGGVVYFTLAGRGSWQAPPFLIAAPEAKELLAWAEGGRAGLGIVKAHDIPEESARNALLEIQMSLYFEREDGTYRWNPEKEVPCPDAIAEVDEIMRRYGLHPTSGPLRKPYVHRP